MRSCGFDPLYVLFWGLVVGGVCLIKIEHLTLVRRKTVPSTSEEFYAITEATGVRRLSYACWFVKFFIWLLDVGRSVGSDLLEERGRCS